MKVSELKEKYDIFVKEHDELQAESFPFTEYVKITDYLPIGAKIDIAQKAAAELFDEDNGIRYVDEVAVTIVRDLTIISAYTDLDFEEEETFEAYDALCQMDFFSYLRDMDYKDIFNFMDIFDKMLASIVDQYNSLSAVMNRAFLRLENRLVDAIDRFSENAHISPEELDTLKKSIKSIDRTMTKVKDVKAAEVVEALKEG